MKKKPKEYRTAKRMEKEKKEERWKRQGSETAFEWDVANHAMIDI